MRPERSLEALAGHPTPRDMRPAESKFYDGRLARNGQRFACLHESDFLPSWIGSPEHANPDMSDVLARATKTTAAIAARLARATSPIDPNVGLTRRRSSCAIVTMRTYGRSEFGW